ncbi:hypothetical protein D3C71_2074650 [compost metagenome]
MHAAHGRARLGEPPAATLGNTDASRTKGKPRRKQHDDADQRRSHGRAEGEEFAGFRRNVEFHARSRR